MGPTTPALTDRKTVTDRPPIPTERPLNKDLTGEQANLKRHIRLLRQKLGLSQPAFGRQFGVTRRTVIRWENLSDRVLPTKAKLDALKKLFIQNGIRG